MERSVPPDDDRLSVMTSEIVSLRDNISPRTEKWIRVSAVLAMIIVAGSSAVLSFDGLKKVALAAHIPEHLAFLFPIAVDTTILMGSLAVLLYELFGVRAVFGWVTVLFGTLLSIVGNVISVKDAGLIAQVLHGIIPVLLCISLESLLRILRFNIKRTRLARTPLPHLKGLDANNGEREDEEPVFENIKFQNLPPMKIDQPVTVAIPREEAVAPPVTPAQEAKPQESLVLPVSPVEALMEPLAEIVEVAPKAPPAIQEAEMEEVIVDSAAVDNPTLVPVPSVDTSTVKDTSEKTAAKPAKRTTPKPASGKNEVSATAKSYRAVLEAFPPETPKGRKVAEILRVYPRATAKDIKLALGDAPDARIDTTMRRAKEWLKTN